MDRSDRPGDDVFVDEQLRVFEGEEARKRLAGKNDSRFVGESGGVTSVDRERWEEAQRYERKTWLGQGSFASDDHNRDYLRPFREYAPLAGRTYDRAIELGCGPFTNMRLILERVRVKEVHLLDPLASAYLEHPYCRYPGRRLGGLRTILSANVLRNLRNAPSLLRELANAVRIGGVRGRPVHLESCAIEDFQTPLRYDLVVMINVLEHCRDAAVIFDKIDEILMPGGVVVFHDRVWDEREVGRTISRLYDAGHPLRVTWPPVRRFIERYERLLLDEQAVVDVEDGIRLERTAVSFIGRKGVG